MKKYLYFFIIFSLLFSACKKSEEDLSAPSIMVFSPSLNQPFAVGDTIKIEAKITDDISIEKIIISVLDKLKNSEVLSAITYTNCGKEKYISCNIIINNNLIESDLYYITIVASDISNSKHYYIPIYIRGLSRELQGIIYLSEENNNTTEIWQIDTLGVNLKRATIPGDYSLSEISSKYQLLFVAGEFTGKLNAIDLQDNTVLWSLANQTNNTLPWFYSINFTQNTLFVGTQNSAITGYSTTGMAIRAYSSTTTWHATKIIETEGRIIAQTQSVATASPKLMQFYSSSANYILEQDIPFLITNFFSLNTENILLVANQNERGCVYSYNFLLHSMSTICESTTDKIIDAIQINSSEFLILTTQQVLKLDLSQQNNLYSISTVSDGKQLLFDEISNQFFVVKNQEIATYSFTSGMLKNTISTTKPIAHAHLLYNR